MRRTKQTKVSTTKTAHKHCLWPWSCPILTDFSWIYSQGNMLKACRRWIQIHMIMYACKTLLQTKFWSLFPPITLISELHTTNQGRQIMARDFGALMAAKNQDALFILTSLFSRHTELSEDMLGRMPLLLLKSCSTTASWFPNNSHL